MSGAAVRTVVSVRVPLAGGQAIEVRAARGPDGAPGPVVIARGFPDELDAPVPGGAAVALPAEAVDAVRAALDELRGGGR